jgi:flagellar biosynthesis/type III secretory pathway M-ring protein FliF/YscJ
MMEENDDCSEPQEHQPSLVVRQLRSPVGGENSRYGAVVLMGVLVFAIILMYFVSRQDARRRSLEEAENQKQEEMELEKRRSRVKLALQSSNVIMVSG